jgi:ssDNA-binding Zn-finger/Zn-ribbon topoisomerase 1
MGARDTNETQGRQDDGHNGDIDGFVDDSAILRPIILIGRGFDWESGAQNLGNLVDEAGVVDWGAAFGADPGCTQCPACGRYLWREGLWVRCPACECEFIVG